MFAGWFPGALEWAGKNKGKTWKLSSREVHCTCDGSHDHCLFEVTPQ
jgi:hypothetical protein